VASLIATSHYTDLKNGTFHYEWIFADGKVVADKLLMDADRSIVANHFQLLADRLRSMDASEPMPEEDG
jgi:hypothetical protein